MTPLGREDALRVQAAQGWLELGNHLEAIQELDQITPALQRQPEVLAARWQIYAKAGLWDTAHETACALTESLPEECSSWIWRAYALRRIAGGGIEPARELLLGVIEKFPREWIIPYNLACYACQLGNPQEAATWLANAFAVGDAPVLKIMALDDPDLKPLWKEIREM